MEFDPSIHPHRRTNPLTGEHVLVSPHRAKRPWLGQIEQTDPPSLPKHDPKCYLCPGNFRAGGDMNPTYDSTFIFENDFAAVLPAPSPVPPPTPHPLFTTEPIHGGCDVVVFHPRHDLTLARLSVQDIQKIINEWISIYQRRGKEHGIKYVQIFENKGSMMGCSNPHPHGQVWSMSTIPSLPETELESLKRYAGSEVARSDAPKGPQGLPCLLCEYVFTEIRLQERVVVKNDHWVALVPWWAIWPFELLVMPYKRHIPSIANMMDVEKLAFADIISKVTIRYDNLFKCSFAYSMGIHQRPTPPPVDSTVEDEGTDLAHLHIHFEPPLLRSAHVRKFLVGFELMAEPQRDLTSEQAAQRLRDCPEIHYQDTENERHSIGDL